MAPLLSETILKLGGQPVLGVRRGPNEIWTPGGPGGLPELADPFEGGYFVGLMSDTQDGNATHAVVVASTSVGAWGRRYANAANIYLADVEQNIANLSVDGFDDWDLGSIWAHLIAYVNFKCLTDSNITSSGANAYEVPPRASNWTASDPAQTQFTNWRRSSSTEPLKNEAFHAGPHFTTTGSSFGRFNCDHRIGWVQDLSNSQARAGRAFRRVAL